MSNEGSKVKTRTSRTSSKSGMEAPANPGTKSLGAETTEEEDAICPNCRKTVEDEQDGVECDMCGNWYHGKCQNVTEELYKVLGNKKYSINWYCDICDLSAKKIMSNVMRIQKRQDDMEKKLDGLDSKLSKLDQNVTSRLDEISRNGLDVDRCVDKVIEKIEDTMEKKISLELEEYRERELRKANLMVSNLKESEQQSMDQRKNEDLQLFKDVLKELKTENVNIKSVTRIGEKANERPRLTKVVLANAVEKRDVLKGAKSLRNSKNEAFKNIYINPDLTKHAREEGKKLRDELARRKHTGETNIAIRRGKIIRLDGPGKNGDFRKANEAEGGTT